jgi:hypothetical protein
MLLERSGSRYIRCRATLERDESLVSSPVLRLRSQRGKELEVISTRMRWPAPKVIPVAHRSITYSYTSPGTIGDGSTGLITPGAG